MISLRDVSKYFISTNDFLNSSYRNEEYFSLVYQLIDENNFWKDRLTIENELRQDWFFWRTCNNILDHLGSSCEELDEGQTIEEVLEWLLISNEPNLKIPQMKERSISERKFGHVFMNIELAATSKHYSYFFYIHLTHYEIHRLDEFLSWQLSYGFEYDIRAFENFLIIIELQYLQKIGNERCEFLCKYLPRWILMEERYYREPYIQYRAARTWGEDLNDYEPIEFVSIPEKMEKLFADRSDWNMVFLFLKNTVLIFDDYATLKIKGGKDNQMHLYDFIFFLFDQNYYSISDWSEITLIWYETFSGIEVSYDSFRRGSKREERTVKGTLSPKYLKQSWYDEALKFLPRK